MDVKNVKKTDRKLKKLANLLPATLMLMNYIGINDLRAILMLVE